MKNNIKCLGWFIRFAQPGSASGKVMEDTLKFPMVRRFAAQQTVDFFWAGEALIFEIIFEAKTVSPQPDPAQAACVPIFRVHGLDDVLASYRAAGVKVIAPQPQFHGREAFLLDHEDHLIGLRERLDSSPLTADRDAARRGQRGEAFNPGCAAMPGGIQELGWIVRRVVDVPAMTAFYRDVVGLNDLGREYDRSLLDLGDGATLELAPGGRITEALPTDRREVPNLFILRVHQRQPLIDRLKAHGVRFIHELIQWDRGALSYFADPEGNLVGIEERYHPSRYAPAQSPFPEDLESERRWRELPGPVKF